MKYLSIIGSTGSIGTQTLEIVRANADLQVVAMAAGRNIALFEEQVREFHPEIVSVADEALAKDLRDRLRDLDVIVSSGMEGLIAVSSYEKAQMVITAVVGMMGIQPTIAAIEAGKAVGLANKETLVCAGHLIMPLAKQHNVPILPVDSEHSAIFQSLNGETGNAIHKILLTASGGPFRGYTREQLENVTLEQALNHPNWSMGSKITIDSASMMNKGLEVIEAKWLFDVPLEKIQIVIHPQSILHSAVEFMDGSVIGQMGTPDMRVPIGYAFAYPDRLDIADSCEDEDFGPVKRVDFFALPEGMTFYPADRKVFRTIDMAYEASSRGGSYPVALNGANEVLVDMFLKGKIRFVDIQDSLVRVMEEHDPKYHLDLEGVLEEDRKIREEVAEGRYR